MSPRRALTAAVAILASVVILTVAPAATTSKHIAPSHVAVAKAPRPLNAWKAGNAMALGRRYIFKLVRAIHERAARETVTTLPKPPPPAPVVVSPAPRTQYPPSYQPCDGEYPPCWRVQTESRGDYNAYNPTGCYSRGRSGCYGKWQFGWFWGGRLGLPLDLSTATPAQQDEAARLLWNHGAGCSNWSAC